MWLQAERPFAPIHPHNSIKFIVQLVYGFDKTSLVMLKQSMFENVTAVLLRLWADEIRIAISLIQILSKLSLTAPLLMRHTTKIV